jgi:hypothetical protein
MRTINARERLDETVPGSPCHPNGEGVARVAGPRGKYLTPGQLTAQLGVTHASMDDTLDKLGIRRRRKDNKEALSVRLKPEQVAAIRRRLGR